MVSKSSLWQEEKNLKILDIKMTKVYWHNWVNWSKSSVRKSWYYELQSTTNHFNFYYSIFDQGITKLTIVFSDFTNSSFHNRWWQNPVPIFILAFDNENWLYVKFHQKLNLSTGFSWTLKVFTFVHVLSFEQKFFFVI